MPKVIVSGWKPLAWVGLAALVCLRDYLSKRYTVFSIVATFGTLLAAILSYLRQTGQLNPPGDDDPSA